MGDVGADVAYLAPWEAHTLRGALEAGGIFAAVVCADDHAPAREEDTTRAREIKDAALTS